MIRRGIALTLATLIAVPAAAQNGPPPPSNQVAIGSAGSTGGVATVNAAAGNQNQQLNAGTIANGGAALSGVSASQHLDNPGVNGSSGAADTSIAAGAFAGFSGWVAVNGVSGNANQQANLAAIAFGIEAGAATDISLAQTRASTEPTGGKGSVAAADPQRSVAIGEGAFEGGSGLVQISLIGGDRNTSANTFALSVSGSVKP